MNEAFLHYLWQFQQFEKSDLRTSTKDTITVLKTGFYNTNSGPDFINARILINEIEWVGNVEIHIKSSDWKVHKHQEDEAYNNVILHVVWENNQLIVRQDGSLIPTLELKSITDFELINKYQYLIDNQSIIPCQEAYSKVSDLSKFAMLDKVLTKRLQQKAAIVNELFENNKGDWEETAYQLLARNFGFKLNSDVFLRLAQNLPLKVLQKHRDNLFQIESMFFGQAGLIEIYDEYAEKLSQEYEFFAIKFSLKARQLNSYEWKFLRTRPANFPTIRLAQLAKLVTQQQSFFSLFTQSNSIEEIRNALKIEQSSYWQEHFNFGKTSNKKLLGLGISSINNIIINTAIPLLAFYAEKIGNHELINRCINFLENLPAEENSICDIWKNMGLSIKTAFDSQASIELYNSFCTKKQCLQCNIGVEILKNPPE
ncbi:hypothetical protein Emtol_3479 [Emticicia oligotrophica DSM 17448]|uniref:DUF2851 family protein n=1 Tax=Emticicia oligotrophica (strain DSM 17448 / CIP 109782 / MTCC 6937 / GPTSA100-15) TaxID=929562 RepID=A0ABM5N556_EMTOG|nr:DUF2851 family protein [Emticicia oligotrophica]AFK04607.1 hypothetical protein Emtol_3479 [Emticicia oligotrophica DSM 17448]